MYCHPYAIICTDIYGMLHSYYLDLHSYTYHYKHFDYSNTQHASRIKHLSVRAYALGLPVSGTCPSETLTVQTCIHASCHLWECTRIKSDFQVLVRFCEVETVLRYRQCVGCLTSSHPVTVIPYLESLAADQKESFRGRNLRIPFSNVSTGSSRL